MGAVRYSDAQVDHVRLTMTLVRTAVRHGARAVSRSEVTGQSKNERNVASGATVLDLETGQAINAKVGHVSAATGVWTEQTENRSERLT